MENQYSDGIWSFLVCAAHAFRGVVTNEGEIAGNDNGVIAIMIVRH